MRRAIFQYSLVLLILMTAPAVWAAGGGKKHRGDWHVENKTPYVVVAQVQKSDGSSCYYSYIDPNKTLGLPKDIHECPFPGIKVVVKVMQRDKEGSCEIVLEEMQDVIFDGEKCQTEAQAKADAKAKAKAKAEADA